VKRPARADPDRDAPAGIATVESTVGNTPLVRLQRIPGPDAARRGTVILAKLEGNNPGGSVKDRPALSMIQRAQERGEIRPGDRLIEATSGNTGIALAMIAAMRGFRMTLIMPDNLSPERRAAMRAYGAELILTPASKGGMEYARDLALQMQARGEGRVLDQFANPDNPAAHYETTGPELWRDTGGGITHFVSSMGTTGTIMGVSRFLKEKDAAIQIVGAQPSEGSQIPGIRKWSADYVPKIYEASRVDRIEYVTQAEAVARRMAAEEGIFGGISSGGALVIALRVAAAAQRAVIVFVVCDRGDRYLSTSVFPG
jgi:cysteine synthase B